MNDAHTELPEDLARAAAAQAQRYRYKTWGFGEDIALRALLEASRVLDDPEPAEFVARLVSDWDASRGPLAASDHVAPGVVLLELHERHGHARLLDTALELGQLLTSFPIEDGVAVHRRDLEAWRDTVWVDCMALDGPFLARLGHATGDDAWTDHAADALLGYARVLQDETGLFVHGYDVGTKRPSAVHWGRGNGWALHGLVDTLEALPFDHPAVAEARERLDRLVVALVARQLVDGRWHTILDDPTSPLEASTSAFFASGVIKARRLALLGRDLVGDPALERMVARAVTALVTDAGAEGGLSVSDATPVGDRATYVDRPSGVFPWGQGPLILTFTEARLAAAGSPA